MFSRWWSVLLIVLWENHYKAEEYRLRNIREPGPYPVCTWDGEMEGLCFLYLVVTMLFKYLIGNNLLWRSEYHFFKCFCGQLIWLRTTQVSTGREITKGHTLATYSDQKSTLWRTQLKIFSFLEVVSNWVCDRSVRKQSEVGDRRSYEIPPTRRLHTECTAKSAQLTVQKHTLKCKA